MRAYEIIKKKRDGNKLSDQEIRFAVDAFVKGTIPDGRSSHGGVPERHG